jgi:uncharacterized protein YbaR (Trm112 family)
MPTEVTILNVGWKDIIADLACPACREALQIVGKDSGLRCTGCKREYPVEDDIPILLVDRARQGA